jgi:hypothetical protein
MITINIDGEVYKLVEVNFPNFIVAQNEPYKNLRWAKYPTSASPEEFTGQYIYESIKLNGKYYGFEPIKNNNYGCMAKMSCL